MKNAAGALKKAARNVDQSLQDVMERLGGADYRPQPIPVRVPVEPPRPHRREFR